MAKSDGGNRRAGEPCDQAAEAERIYERLKGTFDQELRRMAELLAGKEDRHLFGETEFEIRDAVHRLGAKALEAAADERQKKGPVTRVLAVSAPAAKPTPGSSSGGPSG